jgi:hypothetical protein
MVDQNLGTSPKTEDLSSISEIPGSVPGASSGRIRDFPFFLTDNSPQRQFEEGYVG